MRVFRIHFHKKTNYKGKGRGVKPKTRWGMIVARSRLWLWVRRVGGDSFFLGPRSYSLSVEGGTMAGLTSMEGIELLQKTLQRQRRKNTPNSPFSSPSNLPAGT